MDIKDNDLSVVQALPNGAATVVSPSVDTGSPTPRSYQPGQMEFLLTAPALSTAQLPDTDTMTYDILVSTNADLSSPTVLMAGVIVQTGAGGVGDAGGETYRFRLPSDAPQYVGFRAVNSGAGNASAAIATLDVLF